MNRDLVVGYMFLWQVLLTSSLPTEGVVICADQMEYLLLLLCSKQAYAKMYKSLNFVARTRI